MDQIGKLRNRIAVNQGWSSTVLISDVQSVRPQDFADEFDKGSAREAKNSRSSERKTTSRSRENVSVRDFLHELFSEPHMIVVRIYESQGNHSHL